MRYCVSARQPMRILKKADEIKVKSKDKDIIFNFVEEIPKATIILEVDSNEANWNVWHAFDETFSEFYIALHNLGRASEFNENGIKWYWPYPITSFYELNKVIQLRPAYLEIGVPLTFDIERVAALTSIPLRMTANVAQPGYLPNLGFDGICGQWVRPEDAAAYEPEVRCLEFAEVDLKQEETLLNIYKEKGQWQGNLNLIIKKLNFDIDNRLIPEDLVNARKNCGQKCFAGSSCKLCINGFMFSDNIIKYKNKVK